jgi:hypothetical protein
MGGVALIITTSILLLKRRKRKKEKHQQEHHEQWLARQNLEREEQRLQKMAFGGWFGREQGVEGKDFAVDAGKGRGWYGDQMELRTLHRDRGRV